MHTTTRELIPDELNLMSRMLPLSGSRVIDLGCGKAEMPRRLLRDQLVATVTGLEVDKIQHEQNIFALPVPGLAFAFAGADDIPYPDNSFDIAMMFKSLHHVPLDRMDRALSEVKRVLVPGGLLYVSEPVFAGPFNEIVRLFHDEELVRKAALEALHRAIDTGVFEEMDEKHFDMPLHFKDFDDFFQKVVKATHSQHNLSAEKLDEVRRRFERHASPQGMRFVRPMRVNLLRKPD